MRDCICKNRRRVMLVVLPALLVYVGLGTRKSVRVDTGDVRESILGVTFHKARLSGASRDKIHRMAQCIGITEEWIVYDTLLHDFFGDRVAQSSLKASFRSIALCVEYDEDFARPLYADFVRRLRQYNLGTGLAPGGMERFVDGHIKNGIDPRSNARIKAMWDELREASRGG